MVFSTNDAGNSEDAVPALGDVLVDLDFSLAALALRLPLVRSVCDAQRIADLLDHVGPVKLELLFVFDRTILERRRDVASNLGSFEHTHAASRRHDSTL